MRYVEKHFDAPVVIQHEQELTSVNLDEASLLKRKKTEALDGNSLYKEQIRSTEYIPHWKDLQAQMCQDQGGVCCYCGLKLQFPDTQHYSVEHVQPRSKFPELVGEYKNLLLSCHSSELERAQLKKTIHSKKERKKVHPTFRVIRQSCSAYSLSLKYRSSLKPYALRFITFILLFMPSTLPVEM